MNNQPWQERVVIEYRELGDRLAKLKMFIESPKFDALDARESDLLIQQRDAMGSYWSILRKRIESFKR